MAAATKDTIYIDIDDEITSIIDKVRSSKHKIVALVLPKRATTLQSIVNMRLLKRTGVEADKRIVLITSEATLLPLAGIVGMYTAKTLQSKPVIPKMPDTSNMPESVVDEEVDDEPEIDPEKSVGELAGLPEEPVMNTIGAMAAEETIEMDNSGTDNEAEVEEVTKKAAKNKIKVPNFESFRIKLFVGVFVFILLIVGWVFANTILPKASITVKTDNTTVTSTVNFAAQVDTKAVDVDKGLVPALVQTTKKTDTLKVTATGTKNVGEKASGTAQFINCSIDDKLSDRDRTVPAGTQITNGSSSFITTSAAVVSPSSYVGSVCQKNKPSIAVSVTSINSGDQFNLSARSYNVSGFSTITSSGSAMTGGTTKNLTVISQKDLDDAKAKMTDKSKDTAGAELGKSLTNSKLVALPDTLLGSDQAITSVPNVGDEAADVTVTSVTTYTMLGVKALDLQKLVDADAKKQLDIAKQPIVDYGFTKATFRMTSKRSANDQSISMQTVATVGAKLDIEALKKEVIGKKKGDVQSIIGLHPGVKDVSVNFSPPWVSKVPKKTSRITITIEQTNTNGK